MQPHFLFLLGYTQVVRIEVAAPFPPADYSPQSIADHFVPWFCTGRPIPFAPSPIRPNFTKFLNNLLFRIANPPIPMALKECPLLAWALKRVFLAFNWRNWSANCSSKNDNTLQIKTFYAH